MMAESWVALNSIFSLWCSAIGSVSACMILFIASIFIIMLFIHAVLQYQCSTSWPPKWSIAWYSAFNHHSLIIIYIIMGEGFILEKNLQNVWRCRNKRSKSPLQGSHTVELYITKKFMFEDWSFNFVLLAQWLG